jgi:hypothetical protein
VLEVLEADAMTLSIDSVDFGPECRPICITIVEKMSWLVERMEKVLVIGAVTKLGKESEAYS